MGFSWTPSFTIVCFAKNQTNITDNSTKTTGGGRGGLGG